MRIIRREYNSGEPSEIMTHSCYYTKTLTLFLNQINDTRPMFNNCATLVSLDVEYEEK